MLYQNMFRPADPFHPMPNTGTILDVSAGTWVEGDRGQSILNGGVAPFYGIAALPNSFKTTVAAGMAAAVLRVFPNSLMHAHDTETTMQHERIEALVRNSMAVGGGGSYRPPENLISAGRLIFTSSVDYDGTELFDLLKKFCKDRVATEKKIKLEIINPVTKSNFECYTPVFNFWDSFSGLKTKDAKEKQANANVGTSEGNMLAMNFNKGKSDIVEQLPDLTARHTVYVLITAHVGQKYELDPYKPGVKPLKWLKGDVKIKRIPENTTFQTGNFYVIGSVNPLSEKGVDIFPRTTDDKDLKNSDLIDLGVSNMRGKYGPDNIPFPIVVSKLEGWLPYMSNFMFLRQEGKYGFIGNDQNYALALTPDIKMRRTTVRTVFRENMTVVRAAQILMEMCFMFRYTGGKYAKYECTPEELYADLKNKGYDWDLLLNTRYWFVPVDSPDYKSPFISTMDLLKMRLGEYHPYWYPVKQKDLVPLKADSNVTEAKGS